MRKVFLVLVVGLATVTIGLRLNHSAAAAAAVASTPDGPQFSSDGKLVRPVDYRRWVYVSSGFGMSYSPGAGDAQNPAFTNGFVNPSSYEYFLTNGKWPDKTIFVLEEYSSTSHGSINQHGSYQEHLLGLAVEVKDEKRFPDTWAYFGFSADGKNASAITPGKNDCWQCHEQNAAVEHSFVQFYPELLKVARAKGTIKPTVHLGEK
jgi:cytochrome P460